MNRKQLLDLLPNVKHVRGYVRLNRYTEIMADLPLTETLDAIREKLNDKGSPSSRDTSRFTVNFDANTGTLDILG